jgi:hypothetical protein
VTGTEIEPEPALGVGVSAGSEPRTGSGPTGHGDQGRRPASWTRP